MNHLRQQLVSTLEAYTQCAAGLDENPFSVDLWRLLCELGSEANDLFVRCGGKGEPFKADVAGLDVHLILRCRELEAALLQGRRACSGGVSGWLMCGHLRERVQAVLEE